MEMPNYSDFIQVNPFFTGGVQTPSFKEDSNILHMEDKKALYKA